MNVCWHVLLTKVSFGVLLQESTRRFMVVVLSSVVAALMYPKGSGTYAHVLTELNHPAQ